MFLLPVLSSSLVADPSLFAQRRRKESEHKQPEEFDLSKLAAGEDEGLVETDDDDDDDVEKEDGVGAEAAPDADADEKDDVGAGVGDDDAADDAENQL